MARNPDQVQNIVDVSRQRDCCPGKKFVEKDFDRVEPVECLRRRAIGDSFIVVAFAEAPKAYLVEIVEAQGAG